VVHDLIGDAEAALDELEFILSVPHGALQSATCVERDPRFYGLRSNPRFAEILASARAR